MNELDLKIKNPYEDKESYLPYLNYDMTFDEFYKTNVICFEPFINLNLQAYPYEIDGKSFHKFFTIPCCCYDGDNKEIVEQYRVDSETIEGALFNDKIKEFRNKIASDDYSFCYNCPAMKSHNQGFHGTFAGQMHLIDQFGNWGKRIYIGKLNKEYKYDLPYRLNLSIDPSCNLACETCRGGNYITRYIDFSTEEINQLISIIKQCKSVGIGSDGETFFSKTYRNIIHSDLSGGELEEIEVYTNGTLLNERNWNLIHENTKPLIKHIKISVDAATQDTYELVRDGRLWDKLISNIKFLNSIKKDNNFQLETTYTISKMNYKEILEFYQLAKDAGFDKILFNFARPLFKSDMFHGTDFVIEEQYKPEIISCIEDLTKMDPAVILI